MDAPNTLHFSRQYPEDYLPIELGGNVLPPAESGAAATSLDSIETSAGTVIPSCYNRLRFEKHQVELTAVKELYAALDQRDQTRRLLHLEECRKYAWFAAHKETGAVRVISNACHQRWCPVCADAKRVSIKANVSAWIKTIHTPRLVTLTLQHRSDTLAAQIQHLYRSFRLIRQHKQLKKKIRGGVWFFQLKVSKKDGCYHPHLHILLDSDYISQKMLSLEWFETTGNSYIVDIRAIKDAGKVADYVSRYCSKPCCMSDFAQNDRIEVATVLHGKRLCGGFGTGAKCSLKTGKCEDVAQWHRLGNWTDIVLNRHNNLVFREIVRAWSNNDCIERNILTDIIRQESGPSLSESVAKSALSQRQYVIEDFVRKR